VFAHASRSMSSARCAGPGLSTMRPVRTEFKSNCSARIDAETVAKSYLKKWRSVRLAPLLRNDAIPADQSD
jgi:hypothetical protein